MRRNITLFSVAITAFSAVLLASAIYGYRVSAKPRLAPAASMPAIGPEVSAPDQSPELLSAAPQLISSVTPKAAAAAASGYLGRTDLYSVELTQLKGIPAYKVTFISGDVVFLALDGTLLEIVPAQVQLASANRPSRETESYDGGDDGGEQGEDGGHEGEEPEHEEEGGG